MIVSQIRASCSALLIALASPAFAGDAAYPEAIGFSQDGTRFAFAEWGREDGSGFAYANLFVLDLEQDAWLAPPLRITLEDENAPPIAAYRRALERAAPALGAQDITRPARLIYAAPFTEDAPTSGFVTWSRYSTLTDNRTSARFELKQETAGSAACTEDAYVFSLTWSGTLVHEDTRLPSSRGCPLGYRLDRIFVDDQSLTPRFAVALIGVMRRGFEGADMRYIAVPLPLQAP